MYDIYRGEYILHKMIMIFVKGSIYADVFILIFTEYYYIKWLWYLIKDQYMEMCSFWYLQNGVLLHKIIMICGKGSIYGDVYILIFTEESIFYIKWLWYLSKDQYMQMCLFWYFQNGVLLHKIIMIFGEDQYMETCSFWYLQRRVFFT